MNTVPIRRSFLRAAALRRLCLAAAFALLLTSCVTPEVKDLIRDANYEMLLTEAGPTPLSGLQADPATTSPVGSNALSRLEAFVGQHPENKAMVTALRLRQATLYLNTGSFQLARAAFASIDSAELHTPRDQAIYALREHLVWWYQHAQMGNAPAFFLEQKPAAEAAMKALAEQSAALTAAPDARDFLLEMRAWIALKLGLEAKLFGGAQTILADGIDTFGNVFTTEERQQVARGTLDENSGAPAFDPSTRRILRAGNLLRRLAENTKNWAPAQRPALKHPEFQAYYTAKLASASR